MYGRFSGLDDYLYLEKEQANLGLLKTVVNACCSSINKIKNICWGIIQNRDNKPTELDTSYQVEEMQTHHLPPLENRSAKMSNRAP